MSTPVNFFHMWKNDRTIYTHCTDVKFPALLLYYNYIKSNRSDFTFTFPFPALEKEMAAHSSVPAWRISGMGSLVGCRLWGHTELDTTEAT